MGTSRHCLHSTESRSTDCSDSGGADATHSSLASLNHCNGYPIQSGVCRLMKSVVSDRYLMYGFKLDGDEAEALNGELPSMSNVPALAETNQITLNRQSNMDQLDQPNPAIVNI